MKARSCSPNRRRSSGSDSPVRIPIRPRKSGGASVAEFIVGGSYVEPEFLLREGEGRYGNNSVEWGINGPPCEADFAPSVWAGADLATYPGEAVSLASATFNDAGVLGSHTATIDWGDGSPVEAGTVDEEWGFGTVAGSHVFAADGVYNVTVTVTDDGGHAGSDTLTVTVGSGADAIDVVSSDPAIPVANLTGIQRSTTSGEQVTFDVHIDAPDTPQSFELRFVRPLTGQLLGSIPVAVNGEYGYPVRAVDADGDPITFSLIEAPAGATIDPASGAIAWQPPGPGTYAFTVQAADDRGGMDTQTYVLTVTAGAANQNPTITSTPPTGAVAGRDFAYAVAATDPDGEALSYYLTAAPAGMSIDWRTGEITWTPQFEQIGVHSATVAVRDLRGGEGTQTFAVQVGPDVDNHRPDDHVHPAGRCRGRRGLSLCCHGHRC